MKTVTVALTSVSLIAIATPATAQDAPGEVQPGEAATTTPQTQETQEETGADIIITARKRQENLIDVPLPVSVATADQLKRDQIYTITDLQRVTPALEVSQTSGGEVNGGARLRGLGTGVFNPSVSPSVAFVVDQVPQGNLAFPFLFDIAQVEVLRGPQGTLFGQGASAGVINVSTVAPTLDRIKVSGGVDYADQGTLGSEVSEAVVRAAVNVPLTDIMAIRVATQYKREKGLQRNTFLDRDNKNQDFGLRGRLLLEASERLTFNVTGEYTKTDIRGWNFFSVASTPDSTAPFDPDGPGPAPVIGTVGGISTGNYLDPNGCDIPEITARARYYCEEDQARLINTSASISAIMDYELSDQLTLTSVSAYRTSDRETRTVNFSRRLGIAARSENLESESYQVSQEVRLGYDTDGFDLVAGALYSYYNLETTPLDT